MVEIEGPVGFFNYLGNGEMLFKKKNLKKKFK